MNQRVVFFTGYISYLCILLYYILGNGFSQVLYFLLLIPALYCIKDNSFRVGWLVLILLLVVLFMVSSFFSVAYPYYISSLVLLYFVGSLIIALLYYNIEDKIKFSNFIFYTFFVYLIFCFIKYGFFQPDLYNLNIFSGLSRNIVSAFLIFLLIFLFSSYYYKKTKQPILPYLFTLLICINLYGRSAIAVSLILFFTALYINYKNKKITLILLFFILFFIIFQNIEIIYSFLIEKTSFREGLESPRTIMIDEYMNLLTISNYEVFFGRNYYNCCRTIIDYGYNPHNSFIAGHARFGILHTLLLISIFAFTVFLSFIKKRWVYCFLIFLLYMRYSIDAFGLFSPIDVFLFYILFLLYNDNVRAK